MPESIPQAEIQCSTMPVETPLGLQQPAVGGGPPVIAKGRPL
jgi:hypothetical protein